MKFAIGFVVGAAIGRPVLRMVSRRTGLSRKIHDIVVENIYTLADNLAAEEERRSGDDKPKRDRTWRNR